jgi:hypothetical protein
MDSRIIYYQEIFLITTLPILHLTGVFTNMICAKTFSSSNKVFKSNTYRFLTANAIVSALFLLFFSFVPFTQCFNVCESWLDGYILKLYKKYGSIFLCRSLDMVSTFINVSIVIDRYICLSNIRVYKRKSSLSVCLIFFVVISTILFLPNSFFVDITKKQHNLDPVKIVYVFQESSFAKKNTIRALIVATQYTISVASILIVIIGNILLVKKLRSQLSGVSRNMVKYSVVEMRRKSTYFNNNNNNEDIVSPVATLKSIKRKTRVMIEKQTTMLVFVVSVIFVINQITIQCINTAFIFIETHSIRYNYIVILYNICAFVFHGTNIFTYYYFNDFFAARLKKLFFK